MPLILLLYFLLRDLSMWKLQEYILRQIGSPINEFFQQGFC